VVISAVMNPCVRFSSVMVLFSMCARMYMMQLFFQMSMMFGVWIMYESFSLFIMACSSGFMVSVGVLFIVGGFSLFGLFGRCCLDLLGLWCLLV